jgi:hypothetical protein
MAKEKNVDEVIKDTYDTAKDFATKELVDAEKVLKDKSLELRKYLKDIKAVLEEWKFGIEETKEGVRIELRAVALIRTHKKGDKQDKEISE